MRLGNRYTIDERRDTFEAELAAAVVGRPLRAHVGLGPDTDKSLIAIAFAHPDIPSDLVATARRTFAMELAVAADVAAPDDSDAVPEGTAVAVERTALPE